jgi:hypothetical protein
MCQIAEDVPCRAVWPADVRTDAAPGSQFEEIDVREGGYDGDSDSRDVGIRRVEIVSV